MRAFAFVLLALLLWAVPVCAQEAQKDPRALTAERYQVATWPKSGPEVRGWAPEAFKQEAWVRTRVRLDARRAEARLDFAVRPKTPTPNKKLRPSARLAIRRHATTKAAREALLEHLMACTITLEREEGMGEVAFSIRKEGKLVHLAGVRGDLSYELRATGSDDLQSLASALDAQLRLASKPSETKARPTATLGKSQVAPPKASGEIAVELKIQGEARHLSLRASSGASVVRTKTGCLVYPESTGAIELELLLLDKELRVSRHTIAIP